MAPQPRRESLEEVITGYSTTDSSLVFDIIRKAEKLTGICCLNGLQVTAGVHAAVHYGTTESYGLQFE